MTGLDYAVQRLGNTVPKRCCGRGYDSDMVRFDSDMVRIVVLSMTLTPAMKANSLFYGVGVCSLQLCAILY